MHAIDYSNIFFVDKDSIKLDWLSVSPNLNAIENLWGILVDKMHKNCRQFESMESLVESGGLARDGFDAEFYKKLA